MAELAFRRIRVFSRGQARGELIVVTNALEEDIHGIGAGVTPPSSWGESTAPACRSADPRIFFPAHGVPLRESDIREAKKLCTACPVRDDCLALAIRSHESDGIWGGTTPAERRSLRFQLRRLEATKPKARALAQGRDVDIRPLDKPALVVQLMQMHWDARRVARALSMTLPDVEAACTQAARVLEFQRLVNRHCSEGWE
ncbi:WhiB family transcriptional regulator [Streptomyces sp. NPDC020681]|uniref:WhiB family transcriptional regulator n=1 Tax=Streptomyces sp. NPDC020681 TaxID=3365083 RepID=UPI003791BC28